MQRVQGLTAYAPPIGPAVLFVSAIAEAAAAGPTRGRFPFAGAGASAAPVPEWSSSRLSSPCAFPRGFVAARFFPFPAVAVTVVVVVLDAVGSGTSFDLDGGTAPRAVEVERAGAGRSLLSALRRVLRLEPVLVAAGGGSRGESSESSSESRYSDGSAASETRDWIRDARGGAIERSGGRARRCGSVSADCGFSRGAYNRLLQERRPLLGREGKNTTKLGSKLNRGGEPARGTERPFEFEACQRCTILDLAMRRESNERVTHLSRRSTFARPVRQYATQPSEADKAPKVIGTLNTFLQHEQLPGCASARSTSPPRAAPSAPRLLEFRSFLK